MKTYEFTIIARGDGDDPALTDRLFEEGCDDATISFQKGVLIIEFDRAAKNFAHALISAMGDVRKAHVEILHIEPDHLVNLSDIAVRAGISRAAVSYYAKGERAENFPAPVARFTTESPLWDWVEVARWMYCRGTLPLNDLLRARTVRRCNLSITKAGRLAHESRRSWPFPTSIAR